VRVRGRASPLRVHLGAICALAAFVSCGAGAADWTFGGHAKYRYTRTDYRAGDLQATLGEDPASDHDLDLRLKAEGERGPWEAAVHYEILALFGDTAAVRAAAAPLAFVGRAVGLPDDRRRLLDLTDSFSDGARRAAVHRLDRLYVGYRRGAAALRFGRQALSWGNGLVFHPLDFINPFSPLAIDKDYKTGDDMLYVQWLRADGGDLQAIAVPRRDPATGDLAGSESTYAAKLRVRLGEFDLDLVAAQHVDDALAGIGLVRSIGGAVWRLDALHTRPERGDDAWSFVTNLDYSWVWGARNYYGFVEYFRNGFGAADPAGYATPDPALAARLERGELFTLARDYAAAGVQVELHPLFNVYTNLIWNLTDGSRFLQLRGVYDWRQNVQLMAGINLPAGDRGKEYGGIPLPGLGVFLAPGRALYLRAAYYF